MSHSGMLIGMLRVSCQPIEFYLVWGLNGTRSTTLRLRSVDKHMVPPRACRAGAATYVWSQTVSTVDICSYRNSIIVSRSQRLGYKRMGPSGLAELEQLRTCGVEQWVQSACLSQLQLHTLKFILARSITLISKWLGYACGVHVRHDWIRIPSNVYERILLQWFVPPRVHNSWCHLYMYLDCS